MAYRFAHEDARVCFRNLMDAMNIPKSKRQDKGSCYVKKRGGGTKAKVGCYYLASSPSGYTIHKITNEMGGVSTPFGFGGKNPREFCQSANFTIATIREMRKRRRKR